MRVRRLCTGRVRPKRASRGLRRYLPGGWSDETLPVNVYLVEHPDGLCLFDTGQTARVATRGYHPAWHPFLRLGRFELEPDDEVAAQLRRLGIEPSRVRWVVLSHLHTDHVGGLPAFPGAQVVVARGEWERSRGLGGRLRGYLPQHWPSEITPTLVVFEGRPLGPFPGSFDVAGDGSLVLVPTPGHSVGHLALIARDGESGYFLGGDMASEVGRLPAEVRAFCKQEQLTVLLAHDDAGLP